MVLRAGSRTTADKPIVKAAEPTGEWLRNWKNHVKANDPDIVAQMSATCIAGANDAWLSMCDIRPLAEEQLELTAKLNDPELADSPYLPAAIRHSLQIDQDLGHLLVCTASAEHIANRIWQDLSPDERVKHGAAAAWEADPHAKDLIGQAFAAWREDFRWPAAWNPLSALRYLVGYPVLNGWFEKGTVKR